MSAVPIDVASRETADFLAAELPAGACVLEVGCGAGGRVRLPAARGAGPGRGFRSRAGGRGDAGLVRRRAALAGGAGAAAAAARQHGRRSAAGRGSVPWQADRARHRVHPLEAMRAAMADRVGPVRETTVPYFYRYLIPALPVREDAAAWVEVVLEEERRRIAGGEIVALGRRLAAPVRRA
ncbi:hypothetical protein [Marilutibacter chinensis]|uniref:Methyltransferase family protein n=1 Tax=Marilutibacter chinensis TaxID=2912247 RepID=A0ABS9HU07_9GAMM|nr:hypothetical protein [Lysobacter chinensis]MCF7222359.1 hypothetical protein [Lysobacter chinensis]